MLHQEFEQLTSIKVEEQIFNEFINPLYMACSMDKEPFCKDFKKHDLLNSLVAYDINEEYHAAKKKINKMNQERSAMVDFLIDMDDPKCDAKAISMVGHQEVIRRKLEKDYELTDDDKQFLITILHD